MMSIASTRHDTTRLFSQLTRDMGHAAQSTRHSTRSTSRPQLHTCAARSALFFLPTRATTLPKFRSHASGTHFHPWESCCRCGFSDILRYRKLRRVALTFLNACVCRDIAHRSDIPKWLKDDIKHNLQNKLHRFVIFGCHSDGVQSLSHQGGRLGVRTIFLITTVPPRVSSSCF
jgi:hypothetical protein